GSIARETEGTHGQAWLAAWAGRDPCPQRSQRAGPTDAAAGQQQDDEPGRRERASGRARWKWRQARRRPGLGRVGPVLLGASCTQPGTKRLRSEEQGGGSKEGPGGSRRAAEDPLPARLGQPPPFRPAGCPNARGAV